VCTLRELEVELGKVRAFYAKKLESVQRKHQGQMAALRRGGAGGAAFSLPEEGVVFPGPGAAASGSSSMFQAEKRELLSRISLLEGEVLRSAEELGRMRAISVAVTAAERTGEINSDAGGKAGPGVESSLASTGVGERDKGAGSSEVEAQVQAMQEEVEDLREENAKYRQDVKRLERQVRSQDKQLSELMNERDLASDDEGHSDEDEDGDGFVSKKKGKGSQVQKKTHFLKSSSSSSSSRSRDVEQLQKELSDQGDKLLAMSQEWSSTKHDLQASIKNLKKEREELEKQITELQRSLLGKEGEVQHWQGEALRLEMVTQQAKTPQMQQFLVSSGLKT
jgi:hypothetical protein